MPNQPKNTLVNFRLAADLQTKLRAAARREGVTVSELLRRIVTEYLERLRP